MRPLPVSLVVLAAFAALMAVRRSTEEVRAGDILPLAVSGASGGTPRVLVLPNGLTICGDIRRTPSGYSVALAPNTGRTVINEQFIWFSASSLPAAYEELKRRYPDKTAAGHLDLAGWCLKQGLPGQARENIEDALQLEPDNKRARLLAEKLGRLRQLREQRRQADVLQEPATPSDAELMGRFVSLVQPLLLNGCGNANCHGRSTSHSFRLLNIRQGAASFQRETRTNFAAVLRQINQSAPEKSPLLLAPRDARHAVANGSLFDSPLGERRWRALREWVMAVANSDETESELDIGNSEFASLTPNSQFPIPNSPTPTEIDAIVETAMQSGRPDLFDPAAFNRRFAKQTE